MKEKEIEVLEDQCIVQRLNPYLQVIVEATGITNVSLSIKMTSMPLHIIKQYMFLYRYI